MVPFRHVFIRCPPYGKPHSPMVLIWHALSDHQLVSAQASVRKIFLMHSSYEFGVAIAVTRPASGAARSGSRRILADGIDSVFSGHGVSL